MCYTQLQSEKAVDGEKEKEGEDKEAKGACLGCSQEDIDTVAGIQSAIDEYVYLLACLSVLRVPAVAR